MKGSIMNLSINPAVNNNYNSMNCNRRRNNTSFGMAVKVDESAMQIMKDQTLALSTRKATKFWDKLNEMITRNEDNPVNVIIRKCNHRKALAAEVVDSEAATAVDNKVHTQPFMFKNGSLKFAEKAEKDAYTINETNKKLEALPKAEEKDFYAGGELPEELAGEVEA